MPSGVLSTLLRQFLMFSKILSLALTTAAIGTISLPVEASPNKLGALTRSSVGISNVTEGFIAPGSHGAKIFSFTEGGASINGGSHTGGGVGCESSCGARAGGNAGSVYQGGFGLNTGLQLTEPGSAGVATQNNVFGESFSPFEW
jgi:hypothetical protein